MFPPIPKPLRAAIAIVSRIAPRASGRVLFELFCRPPRVRLSTTAQRETVALDQERFERAPSHRTAFEGGEVVWRSFSNVGDSVNGNVVLLHGFGSRGTFMAAFVDPLLESGFNVIVPDLPGHGESSGRRVHLALAVDALLAVHKATGPWNAVVAHSFGGAVTTAAIGGTIEGRASLALQRLVLIGVPESMPEVFDTFANWSGAGASAARFMREQVPILSGHHIDDFRGHLQLRKANVPTLVMHAPDDKEIAFENSDALAQAGAHVEQLAIPGSGHRRILRDPLAIEAACEFLVSQTADSSVRRNASTTRSY